MKRACLFRGALVLSLGVLAASSQAQAQEAADPPPTEILIRPAGEPRPALKYRLVPEASALVPGNAALFYHRALQLMIQARANSAIGRKAEAGKRAESIDEQVQRWGTGPLQEIPREEARNRLAMFQNAFKEMELGASRATCDWELDRRNEGISMLLPEIQEMRSLARLVRLRARLEILDGKTDEAMHWIQVGLVMGRHVSQGPTLIQGLVGVAIGSIMHQSLIELIQAPGTPSLFWALADRPRPFIDLRPALEGERRLLEKELPELSELDRGPWSLAEAQQFAGQLQRKLFSFATGSSIPGTNATVPNLSDSMRRLGIAAMATKIYPEARRALIAEGRPESEVEAMPIVQVAALFTLQEYQRLRDDNYKWINIPYWQSYDRIDRSFDRGEADKLTNPLLTMFHLLTPSVNASRLAVLRLDRQFDALACVEAVRLYAHAHGGKFPRSLEVIEDAPVPLDPATGRPFLYAFDGNAATLTAPLPPGAPNHWSYKINYVLKLAK